MTTIVRRHYPASRLPADLSEGLAADCLVTIEIAVESSAGRTMTLDEILALRRPPYRSADEIVADIRRERDLWD
jgi:hypothetical protein